MQGGEPRRDRGEELLPDSRRLCGRAAAEDDGVDFAQRMGEIHQELLRLQAESNVLMQTISENMKEMGL